MLVSDCCGAPPWMDMWDYSSVAGCHIGICSACKEHCSFEDDD